MDLSIVIVSWNTRALLQACLASIFQHTAGISYEVIVVDNDSADGSAAMVESEFPQVVLLRNRRNMGFGAANNQAIGVARGQCVLFLNSDTEVSDGAIADLYEELLGDSSCGAAGGLLVYPNGAPQWSYGFAPSFRRMVWITISGLLRIRWKRKPVAVIPDPQDPACQVEYVVGADLMVRKSVLDSVGGFDEHFFAYFEETDLCARIQRQGWTVRYVPHVVIMHHLGGAFKPASERMLFTYYTSFYRYLKKHSGWYLGAKILLVVKLAFNALLKPADTETRLRLQCAWQAGLAYRR
jgi:GT2 family glycosyltransferase